MGEGEKKMANSPLQPPTLATFRSWEIQQELVICHHKITKKSQKPNRNPTKNYKKILVLYISVAMSLLSQISYYLNVNL
jgi:hypothetical protein